MQFWTIYLKESMRLRDEKVFNLKLLDSEAKNYSKIHKRVANIEMDVHDDNMSALWGNSV
jgi:hypothetical protein